MDGSVLMSSDVSRSTTPDIWNAMEFGTHIPQRMNPTDFGDPLSLPLAPPVGSHFCFLVKYLKQLLAGYQ